MQPFCEYNFRRKTPRQRDLILTEHFMLLCWVSWILFLYFRHRLNTMKWKITGRWKYWSKWIFQRIFQRLACSIVIYIKFMDTKIPCKEKYKHILIEQTLISIDCYSKISSKLVFKGRFHSYVGELATKADFPTSWEGILTDGEGSARLTSLYRLVQISCFSYWNYIFLFYKTTYLNEEVNCSEPSPSVRVPCRSNHHFAEKRLARAGRPIYL